MEFNSIRNFAASSFRGFAHRRSSWLAALIFTSLVMTSHAAEPNLGAIKSYLVTKVTAMDKASHDYVVNAAAYEKVIQANGGDYNKAALTDGEALLKLIAKMQGDYRIIHNNGYETIEGITAGTKRFAQFDNDLDAGVPKAEATTDSPASSPTLNGYFEDWKNSRYNPNAALGRYVAESRVIDMRGIMSSLQLTYTAIMPEVATKDPALAKRLQTNYAGIMSFLNHVDERERKGSKLTVLEIEEMAYQAKALTDQFVPELKQVVALLDLKLPPKPILA